MSQVAIKIENIGKRYNLLHKQQAQNDSLAGTIASGLKNIFGGSHSKISNEDFWALQNISFEINKGDRVAIIGRNGAGKSTLLKIVSQIVKPTTGRIEFYGRMASLLEVGTGFHGDLSGRENIYLNGSILGMKKHEIDRKFDEIVDFAEIEKFLDTPVKRYSSGMYVRLAFAVAAHLEPEILIVDEVLAVGDAAFQKKCLGKMNDVSNKDGRTILFVSHQMEAVQKLCNVGVLLNNGKLIETGNIDTVINSYVSNHTLSNGFFPIEKNQVENFKNLGRIISATVLNIKDEIIGEIPTGAFWKIKIQFEIIKEQESFVVGFGVQSLFGNPLSTSWSNSDKILPGIYEAVFTNNEILYNTGQYKFAVGLSNQNVSYFYNDTDSYLVVSDAGVDYESDRIVNKSSGLILNQFPVIIKKID